MTNEYNICVNGSRGFNDAELMAEVLDQRIPVGSEKGYRIISGGAKGADTLAENYARKRGIPLSVYKAEWQTHGKAAGFIRNKTMVQMCDELICFWDGDSRGSKHALDYANTLGKPTKVVRFTYPPIPKVDQW